MLKKLIKNLFNGGHSKYKHSSSDWKHRPMKNHQHHGYKHYKKKGFFTSSRSFFSS
ncbi:hypothetical protein [Bacillus sp. V5-8f]|uniref:hypothetical protein n=1 Tax=Bacillus sp. V5-8f TaxID=2053044 RepID=UPI000CADB8C9|nr:hypothetical protein [Bacillus sp. V5-8f]PLT34976.1 hypothetical protein CUU64_06180 [Bacillus sp. V5-8f]